MGLGAERHCMMYDMSESINDKQWMQWKVMVHFKMFAYRSSAWRGFYGVHDTLDMMGTGACKLGFIIRSLRQRSRH